MNDWLNSVVSESIVEDATLAYVVLPGPDIAVGTLGIERVVMESAP